MGNSQVTALHLSIHSFVFISTPTLQSLVQSFYFIFPIKSVVFFFFLPLPPLVSRVGYSAAQRGCPEVADEVMVSVLLWSWMRNAPHLIFLPTQPLIGGSLCIKWPLMALRLLVLSG